MIQLRTAFTLSIARSGGLRTELQSSFGGQTSTSLCSLPLCTRPGATGGISRIHRLTASPSCPTEAPVNQVPYERDFLNHCCTFAHEVLADFHPHAPRLRHIDSWNAAPDLVLDVDSIQRNRVGMRYYRGVLGYFYDRIVRFGSYNRDTTSLGQFDTDWRTELSEMQGLDRYVCGECRDEAGGSRLRDFIHALNISEWDTAIDETEQVTIGSSIQYRGRLPKIDRRIPDDLRPHRNSERPHLDNQCAYRGRRLAVHDSGLRCRRETV